MITVIDIFLIGSSLYLAGGLIFSICFYLKAGIKIDEGVKDTPWHFKLIIWPGVILFWIVLFKKLLKRS